MIGWIFAIIATEAITEIIVESEIMMSVRIFCNNKNPKFLGKLVACGYCTSVWVAAFIAWVLPGMIFDIIILDYFIRLFCLHRASNLFHRLFRKSPFTIVVHTVPAVQDDLILEGKEDDTRG